MSSIVTAGSSLSQGIDVGNRRATSTGDSVADVKREMSSSASGVGQKIRGVVWPIVREKDPGAPDVVSLYFFPEASIDPPLTSVD